MAVIKQQAVAQQEAGFKAEIHPSCPLGDLAHPNHRSEVFRAGIRTVLDLEKPKTLFEREIDSNCPIGVDYTDELTIEERQLVHEKASQCRNLRNNGRCALMNNVKWRRK